jgi:hypothetical protein
MLPGTPWSASIEGHRGQRGVGPYGAADAAAMPVRSTLAPAWPLCMAAHGGAWPIPPPCQPPSAPTASLALSIHFLRVLSSSFVRLNFSGLPAALSTAPASSSSCMHGPGHSVNRMPTHSEDDCSRSSWLRGLRWAHLPADGLAARINLCCQRLALWIPGLQAVKPRHLLPQIMHLHQRTHARGEARSLRDTDA